ncbi:MAG TPA: hypothetical protein ENK18_03495 [Deltaproteobacteria bacterium]|nr:hypothetical protein [Deltaproteobacteria bacterium]
MNRTLEPRACLRQTPSMPDLRIPVVLALLGGCEPEPEPLVAGLDGSWVLEFVLFDGSVRSGSAQLTWSGDEAMLTGQIEMSDPDLERGYDLLGAQDIEALGIALQLVETLGVRRLFIELMPPQQGEALGGWRTRWGCLEAPDSQCGEDGTTTFSR